MDMSNPLIGSLIETSCESCRAIGVDRKGCQELYETVLTREYSDPHYFEVHRLTVDSYCLQHPERYMVSGKSFATHLIRMHIALDRDNDPHLNTILLRWLAIGPLIQKPLSTPVERGTLTISHVRLAVDADDHRTRVLDWAVSAWSAWIAYHDLARDLLERARSQLSSAGT